MCAVGRAAAADRNRAGDRHVLIDHGKVGVWLWRRQCNRAASRRTAKDNDICVGAGVALMVWRAVEGSLERFVKRTAIAVDVLERGLANSDDVRGDSRRCRPR